MVSQSEAGLAVSSINIWTVGRSGYLLQPWLIHLGNGILQVKRSADAAVWRVPVRCTEPTQHFTHTNDRQKMALTVIRSSQVPVEICVHYPSERSWKSCELGVLAVKELRPREVKWLAPLSQPSTGRASHQWFESPQKTRACELEATPPLYLFLFYSSSKVHGPFSNPYFAIPWELVNSIY